MARLFHSINLDNRRPWLTAYPPDAFVIYGLHEPCTETTKVSRGKAKNSRLDSLGRAFGKNVHSKNDAAKLTHMSAFQDGLGRELTVSGILCVSIS